MVSFASLNEQNEAENDRNSCLFLWVKETMAVLEYFNANKILEMSPLWNLSPLLYFDYH